MAGIPGRSLPHLRLHRSTRRRRRPPDASSLHDDSHPDSDPAPLAHVFRLIRRGSIGFPRASSSFSRDHAKVRRPHLPYLLTALADALLVHPRPPFRPSNRPTRPHTSPLRFVTGTNPRLRPQSSEAAPNPGYLAATSLNLPTVCPGSNVYQPLSNQEESVPYARPAIDTPDVSCPLVVPAHLRNSTTAIL